MMKTTIKNVKKLAVLLTLVMGISVFVSAQSKSPVKVADLQKSITSQIAKDYGGYTIKDAYKMDKNKVITYDVNLVKGTQTVCLAFDQNGKFLKAIEPKNNTNGSSKTTAMNNKNHSKKTTK
jgi:hypothetical protein